MKREPGAAHDPVGRADADILRRGIAPDIRVMVRDETLAAVHLLCRDPAVFANAVKVRDQRLLAFGKVREHRRPVVHLGIDIDRKAASPHRSKVLIPDPLKVQRQRIGARARDHQVSAELEEPLDLFLSVDLKFHPIVKRLVVRKMLGIKALPQSRRIRLIRSNILQAFQDRNSRIFFTERGICAKYKERFVRV